MNRVGLLMPTVDEILASSPLAGLRRVSRSGGDRQVTVVRLAERFGADLDKLCATVSQALGTAVEFRPLTPADGGSSVNGMASYRASAAPAWETGQASDADVDDVSAPIVVGETPIGRLVAPHVLGDAGVGARLVLHTAALAAARILDLARRA